MYEKVFQLYYQMNIKPNEITFSALFYSSAKIKDLDQCKRIFNDLNSSSIQFNNHSTLQVNLINALGKCGDMITSQQIFDQITEPRVTAVYNVLMKGYTQADKPLKALSIFEQIPKVDAISYLIAIKACAQIAMLRRARNLYQQILTNFSSYYKDIRIMNALTDMFGKVNKNLTISSY